MQNINSIHQPNEKLGNINWDHLTLLHVSVYWFALWPTAGLVTDTFLKKSFSLFSSFSFFFSFVFFFLEAQRRTYPLRFAREKHEATVPAKTSSLLSKYQITDALVHHRYLFLYHTIVHRYHFPHGHPLSYYQYFWFKRKYFYL